MSTCRTSRGAAVVAATLHAERQHRLAHHLTAWNEAEHLVVSHSSDPVVKAYWTGRAEVHYETAAALHEELNTTPTNLIERNPL